MKKLCILICALTLFLLGGCSQNENNLILPEAKSDKLFTTTEKYDYTCTLEIRCDEALSSSALAEEKRKLLPENGAIIQKCEVGFNSGENVFNILSRTVRERKLHLDFSETPAYGSTYIKGISNLYELDCGEFSGWLYTVNGESPDVGYSQYKPNDGDEIAFTYTCDWRAAYEEEEKD
ncbi:MAG: DUF4430 domain-containing protein [Oscillospiraceae bacterium]|nr:DUF4430 domain-containing protein [Oscillospiraceae bacterium]